MRNSQRTRGARCAPIAAGSRLLPEPVPGPSPPGGLGSSPTLRPVRLCGSMICESDRGSVLAYRWMLADLGAGMDEQQLVQSAGFRTRPPLRHAIAPSAAPLAHHQKTPPAAAHARARSRAASASRRCSFPPARSSSLPAAHRRPAAFPTPITIARTRALGPAEAARPAGRHTASAGCPAPASRAAHPVHRHPPGSASYPGRRLPDPARERRSASSGAPETAHGSLGQASGSSARWQRDGSGWCGGVNGWSLR